MKTLKGKIALQLLPDEQKVGSLFVAPVQKDSRIVRGIISAVNDETTELSIGDVVMVQLSDVQQLPVNGGYIAITPESALLCKEVSE